MMKRLLVRCCCIPQKILGSLPWVEDTRELRIPIERAGGFGFIILPVEKFTSGVNRCSTQEAFDRYVARKFSADDNVDDPVPIPFYVEMAYKSEETPIEVLRRLPSFIEAPADLAAVDHVCPYCFGDQLAQGGCGCGEQS